MTKAELKRALAKRKLPCTNRAIADMLDIATEQAVQKWADESPIPPKHELTLRRDMPGLFKRSAQA